MQCFTLSVVFDPVGKLPWLHGQMSSFNNMGLLENCPMNIKTKKKIIIITMMHFNENLELNRIIEKWSLLFPKLNDEVCSSLSRSFLISQHGPILLKVVHYNLSRDCFRNT